jgi:hypothetical protein
VKICSLYGAGYYYIPGTDVCMRIGGYVRQEWSYGYGDNMTNGPWVSTSMQNTRVNGARDLVWRTRAYITQETRQQTQYGTLRTFLNVGLSGNNSIDFNANRAFIQLAGFTVGLASSYFDHYSVAAIAYLVDQSSDTGDPGRQVIAYTAQLGNGISASISAEAPEAKTSGTYSSTIGAPVLGLANNNNHRKANVPDVVANVRADGAWGSFQVMAAIHESSGGYYGTTLTGAAPNGYPSDIMGWAAGVGLRVNLPMIGPGDYIAFQAAYTEGAIRYISNTTFSSGQAGFDSGHTIGYGHSVDGVFCGTTAAGGGCPAGVASPTNVQLTTAWGIAGGWEHFWTPSLRTSFHGSYVRIEYNATANAILCGAQTTTTANTVNFAAGGATGVASCNSNWSMWQIGSRSQWNLTKDFYMGFDVVYYRMETSSKGAIVNYNALSGAAQPSGLRTLADQEALAVRVRWHRDLP